MVINRRYFLKMSTAAIGATAIGAGLAACGQSASSTTTVTYWDSWVTQSAWVDNEIKLFQQAHPTIKIKKTTQVSKDNLLALAFKSGTAPDVSMIPQTPTLASQIESGWWMPVDELGADATWRSKFPAGTFHEGNNMYKGKVYSAPLTGFSPWCQLYINNKVFREAGLVNADGSIKLPRTWDDVTSASEQIVKKSHGNVYGLGFGNSTFNLLSWWLTVFLQGSGVPGGVFSVDYRTGKYTFGSDRTYTDFLTLFREWKQKGYFYPNSMSIGDEVARAYFERGKFGMTIGGVWNEPEWTQHQFTDYSLTSCLTPDGTLKSYFYSSPGGTFVGINAKTKHAKEAWLWFDWLYSKEAGKRWVAMEEDLSVYPENNDPKLVKFQPFAQYVALTKLSIPGPDPLIRNPALVYVQPEAISPDISDVTAGIYTDQIKDIAGRLKELEQTYQQHLDTAIKSAQQKGYKVSQDDYIFSDWDPTKPYITKPVHV